MSTHRYRLPVKHPAPGAWFRISTEQPMIGILIRSTDRPALFDILFESGHFNMPYTQAREKFLLSNPGKPVMVPESTLIRVRELFDINPTHNGALFRNEIEAHNAINEVCPSTAPATSSENMNHL